MSDTASPSRQGTGEWSEAQMLAAAVQPLPAPDSMEFGACSDRFAQCRVVLLGESSHGTAEFYQARAAITRHLVEHHGFTIIAVEADWPDAAVINRHIRHRPPLPAPLEADAASAAPFQRFPTWMWRNTDMLEFWGWLRRFNAQRQVQVGFYGLDLYNMNGSIAAVLQYLDRVDPEAARVARERYGCLTPWHQDLPTYGRSAITSGYAQCEEAVVAQCRSLLARRLDYARSDPDGEEFLDATQNASLVASAERYYRVMYHGEAESWNLRDTHMYETLARLLQARGPHSKAIVWAHNSHIGDAHQTSMGWQRGELNIGQLCREHHGSQAALIGMGTHTGTVAAAHDWDGAMEVMAVKPSLAGSCERLMHDTGHQRGLLDLRADHPQALRSWLTEPRLERFIGVIYRPDTERWSHYAEASLARQFDAYAWFDRSQALTPLGTQPGRSAEPDLFPFGT